MAKGKILIIDDDQKYRHIISEKLQQEGYETIVASDGEEGIVKARECGPDLLICDMMMPKKDGFEVLKGVKKETSLRRTPFIMLTSVDEFSKIKDAYDFEADSYITKPPVHTKLFESTKLLKNIQLLLSISKNE